MQDARGPKEETMSHEDLRDIICRVIENMTQSDPETAQGCLFADTPCDTCNDTCDVVVKYGIPAPN
jgi:hypothetical protein